MVSSTILDGLNNQINMEMQAYYTYLSMSAYFEDKALKGFASWMFHHAQEEMTHAMKIYDFIHSRRGRVKLASLAEPPHDWSTPAEAVQDALDHEIKVTRSIHQLVKLAREEGDYATDSFLQWFVDEQVEEEEVVDDLLQKLMLIGDFSPGLYLLDRELSDGDPAHEEEAE